MLRLALAIAVAAVLVASASAACSNEGAHASALSYDFTLRANSPTISVATDTITITIDSVGADGRQMSTATIGLEGETATTGYTCHDFDEGITGTPIPDDRMTLSVSFTDFVSASTTPGATVTSISDPSGFTEPGTWTEVDAYKTWVRTVELTFDEEMEVMRNSATIDVTRSITEEFLFFVSAPTQITFEDEDSIEIFDTPDFNILLTGYTVNFEAFDSSVSGTDTTYTVTMTTIIQQPFYISQFVLNSGTSHTAITPTLTDAEGAVTNTATAGSVTYNKQEWDFTFDLNTCGSADTFDFGVTVSCHSTQLGADDCPIDDDTGTTNTWDTATTTESITLPFSEFCSYEGAYAAPFTVDVTTWDEGDGGCAAASPTPSSDFVTGDTVCFRGAIADTTPDIMVDTLTCDGVSNAQNGGESDTATLSSVSTGSGNTCEYTVNQGTMNTDTSTVYTFDIQFTVTYMGASGGAKRRSLLTTETTTASTTLQISANSNQAAGVGVGVGGVTGTSSGSSLGVVVGAIMGAAVLITLAVFVGVVIVLRKSPSDDRSRSNARYNAGGAPEVTPIVIQLNGGNNGAKKTKAAASRPMARVVPDESSAEADNMTSSTAAYSSAESSSAADYSSTAASSDYVSSSYV